MIDRLIDKAVLASFSSEWEKAISIYQQILETDPSHLSAKLGLAFCLMQNNNLDESENLYEMILADFPTNNIAISNIGKIKLLRKQSTPIANLSLPSDVTFVHIPGKTKVVSAVMLGQLSVLLKLNVGQKIDLHLKKRRVELRNSENEYIAALPDDLSRRLFVLIESGNRYEAWIKSVSKSNLEIFIQEMFQSSQNSEVISFPKSTLPIIPLDTNELNNGSDDNDISPSNKDSDSIKIVSDENELELESDEDEEEPEMLDQLAEKITEEEATDFSSNYDDGDLEGNDE